MNTKLLNVSDFLKIGIMAWLFIFLAKMISRKIGLEEIVNEGTM